MTAAELNGDFKTKDCPLAQKLWPRSTDLEALLLGLSLTPACTC